VLQKDLLHWRSEIYYDPYGLCRNPLKQRVCKMSGAAMSATHENQFQDYTVHSNRPSPDSPETTSPTIETTEESSI
jgi:hypothetical protein